MREKYIRSSYLPPPQAYATKPMAEGMHTIENAFEHSILKVSYRTMVSSRSGPTEMIFTGTPVSRSMNSTYCLNSTGKSS